jgi:hypothetical protein
MKAFIISNVALLVFAFQCAPTLSAPVANPDNVVAAMDMPVTFAPLANDEAVAGTALSGAEAGLEITAVSGISSGNPVINAAKDMITYTPANGFNGAATFKYKFKTDAEGESNLAVVTVQVGPLPVTATAAVAPLGLDIDAAIKQVQGTLITLARPGSPAIEDMLLPVIDPVAVFSANANTASGVVFSANANTASAGVFSANANTASDGVFSANADAALAALNNNGIPSNRLGGNLRA